MTISVVKYYLSYLARMISHEIPSTTSTSSSSSVEKKRVQYFRMVHALDPENVTPWKNNHLMMYLLFKMVIFQPELLVCWKIIPRRVTF